MAVQCIRGNDTAFEVQQAQDFQRPRCLVAAGSFALSQAHSRLRCPDVDHVQRGALPATLEGTAQGFAIHRHHTAQFQSVGLGEACHEPAECGLERLRVQQAKTRLKVSWLGTPCCNCRTSRSSPSLDCPNVAMSEGPSAPHSVAARAMNKTSSNSCRALSHPGVRQPSKSLLEFLHPTPPVLGESTSRIQVLCVNLQ